MNLLWNYKMDKVTFTVNGEHHSLGGSEICADTTLIDYLRGNLNLFGTKAMCHEGGCGACIVSVSQIHPGTKERRQFSVNSCLVNVLSCHEWEIITIEGIGNRRDGYHSIQSRLADFNGTQCGYCSPGWVMSMYSLYEGSEDKLSTEQIENSFAGNMCRCTGYRSILDAMKSFASDAVHLSQKILDLEDLDKMQCVKKRGSKCSLLDDDWCVVESNNESLLKMDINGGRWYKAASIKDVFQVLSREGTSDYDLVAGNTGKGVYPLETFSKIQIDISAVEDIIDVVKDVNLVVGAAVTLTDLMTVFQSYAKNHIEFRYLNTFHKYLDLIGHIPMRNVGTIGGNLALKNSHHEFPSDVFLLLATVGATVTIVDSNFTKKEMGMKEFLAADLKNKMIINVKWPPFSDSHKIRTYKVTRRTQNDKALINGGFLFKLDEKNNVTECTIVFGGITPDFIRARKTENSLIGLNLFSNETLQAALAILEKELVPVVLPSEPTPLCRKTIALGLFFKAFLSICPTVSPRYKSGGSMLEREVSRGTQTFETDKTLWPLNKPINKLEGLAQCSGEVRYSCDVSSKPQEVHVAFVLSTICVGEIVEFDASEALKVPGVVAVFTAKDIPGKNSFLTTDVPYVSEDEEILASKKISYNGQPIGLIAAKTQKLAIRAANLVKVTYIKSKEKPVLSIKDALKAASLKKRVRQDFEFVAQGKGTDTKHVIKGDYSVGSQYHYTMETQCCTVTTTEHGLSVRSATQYSDLVQAAVARSLKIANNQVNVIVSQVGGGYGGKAKRSSQIACACALVAHMLNRTATLVMPLTDNMAAIGKRMDFFAEYEVGIDDQGLIQYLDANCYSDSGSNYNDASPDDISQTLSNMYKTTRWNITGYSVLTDKPPNTCCTGHGKAQAIALLEHIMERIEFETKLPSEQIRVQNLLPKNMIIQDLIDTLKKDCEYEDRKAEINKFNSENAWKKRGLKIATMNCPVSYEGTYPVLISVYHEDGTIVVSHGGIEMGQGVNTKVAQACAYTLQVPVEKVVVKPSYNFVGANASVTVDGASSECLALAAVDACKELLKRLEPARNELFEPTWEDIIKKAYEEGINVQVNSALTFKKDKTHMYHVCGVCAAEVELDVLTGNHMVLRVDLLQDTGVSINPDIDIGQIEGAFVMGMGLFTSEELIFDQSTGRLLTDRTWTYKPPGCKDIPVDFRVTLSRDSERPAGLLQSKATSDPALSLAVVVTFALHEAILEARKEFGYNDTSWVELSSPATVENILKAISPKISSYKLNET